MPLWLVRAFAKRGGQRITVHEATTLINEGAQVIDVRESDEFDVGHITGAKNIPNNDMILNLHNENFISIPAVLIEIDSYENVSFTDLELSSGNNEINVDDLSENQNILILNSGYTGNELNFEDLIFSITINGDFIDPKIFIISGSWPRLPLPICKYLGTHTLTLSLLLKGYPHSNLIFKLYFNYM